MTDTTTSTDSVSETTANVIEFLSPFDDVDVLEDRSCSLQWGSARVFVTVGVFDEDQAVVRVRAQCVSGATTSPELFKHVATFQADMGHLTVAEETDGTATISFSHSLMGEFLNPAELRMAVVAVAHGADEIDDALAAQFGGQVYQTDANL